MLQNRALKSALNKEKRYNTKALHIEAKLEKLHERRQQHLLQHMFQISRSKGFGGWKKRGTSIVTRMGKKKLMKIKKPNTEKFKNSISYLGPKAWNGLPLDIQKIEDPTDFKNKVDRYRRDKKGEKRRLEMGKDKIAAKRREANDLT